MCDQDCTCVSCTMVFGQQLTSLIHNWSELTPKKETCLERIIIDIGAVTSALSQLFVFLEQDKVSLNHIFTSAGHQEIKTLTIKGNLIFKAVIILFQKATERKDPNSGDGDRKVSSCFDAKSKEPSEKIRDDEKSQPDENLGLLVGPVPSLTSIKTFGLIGRLHGQWQWLSKRLGHCQTQLEWVRKGLQLYVQMGRVAFLANQGSITDNGNFESQVVVRLSITLIRNSQLKYAKTMARKQQYAEKLARRGVEAQKDKDTTSVHSSTSGASASTVVVEETPTVKSPDKIITSPVFPPSSETIASGPQNPVQLLGVQAPTRVFTADNDKIKVSGKLLTSLNDLSLKVSDTMSEWTHKIFGKEDEFSKDWESQELEAWVFRADTPNPNPLKVPFGHQRLQYGLKTVKSKKGNTAGLTTFARYIESGPRMQVLIDEVVREANKLQKRERVCLAFQGYRQHTGSDPFTIVFFSIREEKAPISFKDCIGRNMTFPFETCRTWQDISVHIKEAFLHIPSIGPHVMEGHYCLENSKNGDHILPGLWSNTIKPGDSIKMLMWPNLNTDHPLRCLYGPPPFGPPRQVAENIARQRRFLRIQNVLANTSPDMRGRMPPAAMPPMPRPAGPMGPPRLGVPRPPMPRFPPTGVSIVRRPRKISRNHMTAAEEKELTFVNFVEELERTKNMTVTDVLAKFTHLHDVLGQKYLEDWAVDNSHWDTSSDSDSDDSDTSSLGSVSIIDD